MSHYVYIIESAETGRWYYGYTTDLNKRLEAHNKGLNKSTQRRGPWRFVFARVFDTKTEALHFELYLKRVRNRNYIRDKFSKYFL